MGDSLLASDLLGEVFGVISGWEVHVYVKGPWKIVGGSEKGHVIVMQTFIY